MLDMCGIGVGGRQACKLALLGSLILGKYIVNIDTDGKAKTFFTRLCRRMSSC
jgi:hypothetical protein